MVLDDVSVPSLFKVNSVIDLDPSLPTYRYVPSGSNAKKSGLVPAEAEEDISEVKSPVLLTSKMDIVVLAKFATYRNLPVGSTTFATGLSKG